LRRVEPQTVGFVAARFGFEEFSARKLPRFLDLEVLRQCDFALEKLVEKI
jgi:hypothetical protein